MGKNSFNLKRKTRKENHIEIRDEMFGLKTSSFRQKREKEN